MLPLAQHTFSLRISLLFLYCRCYCYCCCCCCCCFFFFDFFDFESSNELHLRCSVASKLPVESICVRSVCRCVQFADNLAHDIFFGLLLPCSREKVCVYYFKSLNWIAFCCCCCCCCISVYILAAYRASSDLSSMEVVEYIRNAPAHREGFHCFFVSTISEQTHTYTHKHTHTHTHIPTSPQNIHTHILKEAPGDQSWRLMEVYRTACRCPFHFRRTENRVCAYFPLCCCCIW